MFERTTHAVRPWECVVDGLAAEAAGLVACIPFCFDELRRGVAFEFSSGAPFRCLLPPTYSLCFFVSVGLSVFLGLGVCLFGVFLVPFSGGLAPVVGAAYGACFGGACFGAVDGACASSGVGRSALRADDCGLLHFSSSASLLGFVVGHAYIVFLLAAHARTSGRWTRKL